MHKINPEMSKRAKFERDEKKKKGRELNRNVRKEGKKKQFFFFFNRLRVHRAGKKNFGEHVVPTKEPQYRKKEK
jgi:hypothetical protein